MFDVNQDSRISIEQIVAHPWFSRPLPARYTAALAALQKEQASITSRFSVSNYRSKERDALLQTLLDRATVAPAAAEGIMRVPLARTRDALATLPPIDTSMGTITEGSMTEKEGPAAAAAAAAPAVAAPAPAPVAAAAPAPAAAAAPAPVAPAPVAAAPVAAAPVAAAPVAAAAPAPVYRASDNSRSES